MGSEPRVLRRWLGIVVLASAALSLSVSAANGSPRSSFRVSICPRPSMTESIFRFRDGNSDFIDANSLASSCVNEGDEASLQKAMDLVLKGGLEYVAVFFYAAWCPFSKAFKPKFPLLASLYPSIAHIAVEESAIRPSILSKYGVHGFPTLLVLNSTMRVRYHGSRTLTSLVTFYNDIVGLTITLPDKPTLSKVRNHPSSHRKPDDSSCPFSWPRSPEKLLTPETYLALASAFVLIRLLYLIFPTLVRFSRLVWRRQVRIRSILDHPRTFLKDVVQAFRCLVDPCKRSNLQEGAMNARAWASKSLATTVSIGEGSTSRAAAQIRECC